MGVQGWKYYNHAMIPTTAPHEPANLEALKNGSLWKENPKAIMARWTTDWDCGYQTQWWYCIRDGKVNIEELPKQARKNIRKGLKNCDVRKVSRDDYFDQIYDCYVAAWRRYKNAGRAMAVEEFRRFYDCRQDLTFWAAFERETEKLVGYLTVDEKNDYAEICQAKFHPEYLHIQVSAAIYYTVLMHYLEEKNMKYVSSGTKSINHETNSQEYKESTFGYRKAYCRLHVVYNPKVRWVVRVLYSVRGVLRRLDSIRVVHLINAVLKMEEVAEGY